MESSVMLAVSGVDKAASLEPGDDEATTRVRFGGHPDVNVGVCDGRVMVGGQVRDFHNGK
jgi:hypothetical protein